MEGQTFHIVGEVEEIVGKVTRNPGKVERGQQEKVSKLTFTA